MANHEFSLDDFLNDDEPAKEIPQNTDDSVIEDENFDENFTPEDAGFEEPVDTAPMPVVLSGEFTHDDSLEELRRKLTEPVSPTPDDFDNIIAGLDWTEPEVIVVEKEVPKKNLSPLEEAAAKVAELAEAEAITRSDIVAKRRAINELEKQLNAMRDDLSTIAANLNVIEREKYVAHQRVTEEEHREAERKKEEEVNARKNSAVAGFKQIIDDLNPEWRHYAYDHQWEGASTLALHGSGILADGMGMGKTLEAIMHADMTQAKRILVIAPNDTVSNFTMEWAMWAPHRFVWTLAGNSPVTRRQFLDMFYKPRLAADQDFVLTINYEQLYTDMEFFGELMQLDFDTIYVDEFHNVKNKRGLLFKRLASLRPFIKNIIPMTGTPILNSPEDIWTALHLIDPKSFPEQWEFLNNYCTRDLYTGKWKFRSGGESMMLKRLGGRIVKRTMAEAGIVLPKQHIHQEELSFNGAYLEQQRIMRELAAHSQIILDSERKTSIIEQIALITRQRQAAVFPAGIKIKDPETGEVVFSVGEEIQESIKIDWAEDKIIKLREEGKRICLFSQFAGALEELESRLSAKGYRVVRYDGSTSKEIKGRVKRDFDRKHVARTGETEWDIVLCNYKTGGVGLNFTDITETLILDREWSPGKEEQAFARTNRIGQTQETNVYIPTLKGSIDTWMNSLNEEKRSLVEGFDSEVDLAKEFTEFLNIMKRSDISGEEF